MSSYKWKYPFHYCIDCYTFMLPLISPQCLRFSTTQIFILCQPLAHAVPTHCVSLDKLIRWKAPVRSQATEHYHLEARQKYWHIGNDFKPINCPFFSGRSLGKKKTDKLKERQAHPFTNQCHFLYPTIIHTHSKTKSKCTFTLISIACSDKQALQNTLLYMTECEALLTSFIQSKASNIFFFLCMWLRIICIVNFNHIHQF